MKDENRGFFGGQQPEFEFPLGAGSDQGISDRLRFLFPSQGENLWESRAAGLGFGRAACGLPELCPGVSPVCHIPVQPSVTPQGTAGRGSFSLSWFGEPKSQGRLFPSHLGLAFLGFHSTS